ncbi:hypothetical protein FF80_01060 [Devosia sp. LC5]|nr:hypothetical protein FF80_01060 [Devosia sp. LC5]
MCNLYAHLSNQQANLDFVSDMRRINANAGNLVGHPAIFSDYPAPIVRNTPDGPELAMVRWGMPSSKFALLQQ